MKGHLLFILLLTKLSSVHAQDETKKLSEHLVQKTKTLIRQKGDHYLIKHNNSEVPLRVCSDGIKATKLKYRLSKASENNQKLLITYGRFNEKKQLFTSYYCIFNASREVKGILSSIEIAPNKYLFKIGHIEFKNCSKSKADLKELHRLSKRPVQILLTDVSSQKSLCIEELLEVTKGKLSMSNPHELIPSVFSKGQFYKINESSFYLCSDYETPHKLKNILLRVLKNNLLITAKIIRSGKFNSCIKEITINDAIGGYKDISIEVSEQ